MKRPGRWTALVLAVAVTVGVVFAVARVRGPVSDDDRAASPGTSTVSPSSSSIGFASRTPSGPPSKLPTPVRPPVGTLRVPDSYFAHYGARRVDWSDVISRGKPLPKVTPACRRSWEASGKDKRLNWRSVDFLCLDSLAGHGFTPQGIAGSGTAERYAVGSRPAAARNIVLTSWYSRAAVPGLFAPNRAGESVTRLVVIDLDQRRYNVVELVRTDGRDRFRNLNSHGSGLAWAGQYLYSSSHAKLWMYNADDLVEIAGRFVLPAVSKWTADGRGGLSSISLDRSTTPHRLQSINYSRTGQAYLHSFELADNGLLKQARRRAGDHLVLANQHGERGRTVPSARSAKIPGTSFQGVGTTGPYTFANSSGLKTPHSGSARVDATVVLKKGRVMSSIRMPNGNGESVYLDTGRGTYLSMVEGGDKFLFVIPLEELITTAERAARR